MQHHRTMLAAAIAAAILAGRLPALAVPRYWEADVRSPAAFQTAAYRGETVQLTARLMEDGRPFAVPAGATARMLVSTNDFRGGCWEWPAAVSAGGVVRATWTPDMDPGAGAVRIFLAVSESGTNINYGANCTMRLLGSPGAVPNALPLPAATIDFSRLEILGAPWPDFGATSNIVSDAIAAIDIPDTSLEPATNYTDTIAVRVAVAATNYTDEAIAGLIIPDPDLSFTNDVYEAIAEQSAQNALMYQLVVGTNVIFEVTNYNSRVHAPSLRVLQLSGTNTYNAIWTETRGLADTLDAANLHADAASLAVSNALDAAKADRAWGKYTSGLGADAPEGFTWISTPEMAIGGGLEYERHVTTGGDIWVLRANGMVPQFHATTNNAAYFEISNADGSGLFRIEKADSFLVGVDVASVTVDGSTLVCNVDAIAAEHPYARVKASLTDPEWAKEEDGIPASLATVSWSGQSGAWVCRITNNTGGSSLFATMQYLKEGGAKIVNEAALDVSAQGILCTDGIHRVRPVWSSGAISWEVVP